MIDERDELIKRLYLIMDSLPAQFKNACEESWREGFNSGRFESLDCDDAFELSGTKKECDKE